MTLPSNRYLAVDVLRGLTVALMIVVNMSISEALSYRQLLHSTWHGFTLTDLVFPTFLFVVGAAMGFTLERYQELGAGAVLAKVARRAALIFACGVVVSNFPFFSINEHGGVVWQSLSDLRILGVLQRIGLAYAVAALLLTFTGVRGALVYSLLVLPAYWWALAQFGDYSLTGNAPLKVDTLLLGASHLYKGEGLPFDPEGILGTFPAVVNVLAGYGAVAFLRRRRAELGTVTQLAAVGAGLLAFALVWNLALPINKKLWTSSYVVLTVGIDLLVLAALVLLIDVRKVRFGTSYFAVFGKNTLAIYMLSEFLMAIAWTVQIGGKPLFMQIYAGSFQWWAGGKPGSLLFGLALVQFCWLVGFVMDRKRFYVRL